MAEAAGGRGGMTRRGFIKTTAAAGLAAGLSRLGGMERAFAAGSERLRVGLVGCGGRGTGAVLDCLAADGGVEVVALADVFQDRIDDALVFFKEKAGDALSRVKVEPQRCWKGFDAYQKLLACPEVDVAILATPPHFRPLHLGAAVEAGKHVFMEKPVAVDPVGVRSVIASSEQAQRKNLAIVAGTQRRHSKPYLEVMRRIHDGAIGEIVAAECYWLMGGLGEDVAQRNWRKYQQGRYSALEWQCRTWLFFVWLSGDHIVEQHVHNIDVMNWGLGGVPEKALGMGGRQVRTGPEFGNVFDHFAVEYEYPGGVRAVSLCRQTPGCADRVSERLVGTKGVAYLNGGTSFIRGENPYKFEGEATNPLVQEHADLIAGIRAGKPLNEGVRIAESTLTAILGRMSAYTGREVSYKWVRHQSKLDLRPERYELGDLPVAPVAAPGQTELV